MRKKQIQRALLVYFTLIAFSIVTSACCDDMELRISGNGTLTVFDMDTQGSNPENKTDIIDGPFRITADFSVENLAYHLNFGPIEGVYATSCDYEELNQLVEDSLKLTLNKDFIFEDETIVAGANLIDFELIEGRFGYGYGLVSIEFKQGFIDAAQFNNEMFTFELTMVTDDSLQLENAVTIEINVP